MPQPIADLIAAWAPTAAFIAILIFFVRSSGIRARGPSGRSMVELYELQLDELRRSTAALERIAGALERGGGGSKSE
jgi:hypothetical protein